MLKPYKFVVVSHAFEYAEDGEIIGERLTDSMTFYGDKALRKWLDELEEALVQAAQKGDE